VGIKKEIKDIEEIINSEETLLSSTILDHIQVKDKSYPIYALTIGTTQKDVPTFGLFAGVHGLERVGTHLAITFLQNLLNQLSWDKELRSEFNNFRIVAIPLINPGGMAKIQRSNPNGIDLMRNAPVDAEEESFPLLAGHRISPKLPWYRGEKDQKMEKETMAVINFVKEEMFMAPFSMALDLHSGFGTKDRLWYPYAKTTKDFPYTPQMENILTLLNITLPHHIYTVEQQAVSYTANGDLWDYLFDLNYDNEQKKGHFIPFTLELGSWLWVKKNPAQILSLLGMFNPVKEHRFERVMRRHLMLFDFLKQATKNHKAWMNYG
jgi:hypothetical protein